MTEQEGNQVLGAKRLSRWRRRSFRRFRRWIACAGIAIAILLDVWSGSTNSVGYRFQCDWFRAEFVVAAMIVDFSPSGQRGWSRIDEVASHYNGLYYWTFRTWSNGFAVPLFWLAGFLFVGSLVLLVPDVLLLFRHQVAAGHCRQCEYDLTGNVSGICPECGAAIPLGQATNGFGIKGK